MKPTFFFRASLAVACVVSALGAQAADDGLHWAYEGAHGPAHWGDLSPDFVQCKVGVNQSPINIVDTIEADLPPLVLDYKTKSIDLINNGHTAQVNVEPGNFLRVEGEEFQLLQFHIHVPSEHHINGEPFELEVHYVHQNAAGELAVIGILYDEGDDHPKLAKYMAVIPEEAGKTVPYEVELAQMPIVDIDKDYYRYNGSLTTPPCSEGVRWFVLKETRTVSKQRIDRFNHLIGDDARGPQPVNARPVLR